MAAKTIRVTVRTHAILRELASANVVSIPALLDELVEQYRREQFFLDLEAAYARLRADPAAWAREVAERTVWGGHPRRRARRCLTVCAALGPLQGHRLRVRSLAALGPGPSVTSPHGRSTVKRRLRPLAGLRVSGR